MTDGPGSPAGSIRPLPGLRHDNGYHRAFGLPVRQAAASGRTARSSSQGSTCSVRCGSAAMSVGDASVRPCNTWCCRTRVWPAIDSTSLAAAAGGDQLRARRPYLRQGAVTRMRLWTHELSELQRERARQRRRVATRPWPTSSLPTSRWWSSSRATASCPVGFDCKHVRCALAGCGLRLSWARTGPQWAAESGTEPATWEQSVESWLDSPASLGQRAGHRRRCSASS